MRKKKQNQFDELQGKLRIESFVTRGNKLLKGLLFIILSFSFLLPSKEVFSYPPVVSANGFFCSRSQSLVTCQGQFPNIPGSFTASGFHFVQFNYESLSLPKIRYFYDSTNGCLMQITLNPAGQAVEAFVKNARGVSQRFSFPVQQNQASLFCKS